MDPIVLNLVGLAAMFVLLAMGMPIGFAMGAIGAAGAVLLIGVGPSLSLLGLTVYETVITNELSVVPLFVLMGFFATGSGLSEDLYRSCNAWLGHRRGGLALATIGGCGAFAAICGSSLATAATMSQVALPEMRRYRYDERLATGAIAAGGTIGILIPPSVILVLYGILTESDIGQLFAAGIVPGILTVIVFMATVSIIAHRNPEMGPPGERASTRRKLAAIKDVWATIVLFVLVIGGIYTGAFTPTEAAGIGAMGAFDLAVNTWTRDAPAHRKRLLRAANLLLVASLLALLVAVVVNLSTGAEPASWPGWVGYLAYAGILVSHAVYVWLGLFAGKELGSCLLETTRTTAMIFTILIGAILLNKFLTLGGLADALGGWVDGLGAGPLVTIMVILLIYLVLGCALDSLAMILLTIPIFFPIVLQLGFDPIWFGVIVVMVVELGLITPPVGMNVFIIKGMAPDVPLSRIYSGVLPFVVAEVLLIAALVAFPGLATWLPGTMG